MRIAIDSGTLNIDDSTRGLGVYTKNLFESLQLLSKKRKFKVELIDVKNSNLSGFDLIHYPKFDLFFPTLTLHGNIATVVTIHDTTPLLFPNAYPSGIKGKISLLRQKRSLRRVNAVITDSETSKKDIIRNLGVEPTIISTVYLGPSVNKSFYSKSKEKTISKKYNLPIKYVVYVGDVNYNKNVNNLCAACVKNKTHLVIVGSKAASTTFDKTHIENKPLLELQTKYGNSEFIHIVGFVEDQDLPNVIKQSVCYCQPSFYEGFGLGVLDAMTLGVPTLCGKTQALVELYEKASIFADPTSVDAISQKLKELITNKKTQDELKRKGLALAKTFSWEKTAEETLNTYLKVLS